MRLRCAEDDDARIATRAVEEVHACVDLSSGDGASAFAIFVDALECKSTIVVAAQFPTHRDAGLLNEQTSEKG